MSNPKQQLPAWYYRLLAIEVKEERDIYPEDLEESEVDKDGGESVSTSHECVCNTDFCECGSWDEDDKVSERSYNGSDAHCYYELKGEREERKRELRDIRQLEQEEKKEQYIFEETRKRRSKVCTNL